MKKLLVIISLLFPFTTKAAGLVPCGGEGEPLCNICYVFVLIQNLFDFLSLKLIPPIVILVIIVAGLIIMFSLGGQKLFNFARNLLKSVIIGTLIFYGSWIVVSFSLNILGIAEWNGINNGGWSMTCAVPDVYYADLIVFDPVEYENKIEPIFYEKDAGDFYKEYNIAFEESITMAFKLKFDKDFGSSNITLLYNEYYDDNYEKFKGEYYDSQYQEFLREFGKEYYEESYISFSNEFDKKLNDEFSTLSYDGSSVLSYEEFERKFHEDFYIKNYIIFYEDYYDSFYNDFYRSDNEELNNGLNKMFNNKLNNEFSQLSEDISYKEFQDNFYKEEYGSFHKKYYNDNYDKPIVDYPDFPSTVYFSDVTPLSPTLNCTYYRPLRKTNGYKGIVRTFTRDGVVFTVFEEGDSCRLTQAYYLEEVEGGKWLKIVPKYNLRGRLKIDSRVIPAYIAMIEAAKKDGITGSYLYITSGFRSKATQQYLWNRALLKYGSRSAARQWVAPPGGSAHHTGRAIDINMGGGAISKQKRTDAYKWMIANAHNFGFFNYRNEPWHWEYNPK